MVSEDELQELTGKLISALEKGGFPSNNPPADITIEDGLLKLDPVVTGEWEDALEDTPPVVRQESGEEPEEFLLDYIDLLSTLLEDDARQQVDIDAAAEVLDVGMVAPPPDEGMGEIPESDILPEEKVPGTLSNDELWQEFDSIIRTQGMKREERETKAARLINGAVEEDFPGVFDNLGVQLVFSSDTGQLMALEIGGRLTDETKLQVAGGTAFSTFAAQKTIQDQSPRAVYLALAELLHILRGSDPQFERLREWLQTVEVTDRNDIAQGKVDLDELFIERGELRPLVRRAARTMWVSNLDNSLQETSVAWFVAQRAYECQQGAEQQGGVPVEKLASTDPACLRVANRASPDAVGGTTPWYFQHAWERLRDNTFDPAEYLVDFFGVSLEADIGNSELAGVYGVEPTTTADEDTEPVPEEAVEELADNGGDNNGRSVNDIKSDIRDRI